MWMSGPDSKDDKFSDMMILEGLSGSETNCWQYLDVYGNTHLFGNLYGPQKEWDGSLVLTRWDD